MPRKLILLLVIIAAGLRVHAQEEETRPVRPAAFIGHEFVLGHGLLPVNQVFAGVLGVADYTNNTATGALSLTYRYHISRVISIGLAAMYEHEDGTWRTSQGLFTYWLGGYQVYGNFSRTCFTLAPEMTFNYGDVADGMLRFYGVFGTGITMRQQTADITGSNDPNYPITGEVPNVAPMHFNMQLTPFGMRYGKALGGFVEIGFGYKGIFNYGVTYRF